MGKFKKIFLEKSGISKKIICLYIIFILLVSIISIVGLSDIPDIQISPDDGYSSEDNYVNITVDITSSENVSSFINFENSLVGYWNFEHINQTHIFDNSTYNNSAEMNNRFQSNNTTGRYGQVFYFNGSGGGQLNISHSSEFDITDELTIELWFKEFETSFNLTLNNTDPGGSVTNSDDYGCCIRQTSDGGYIVAGETNYSSSVGDSGDVWLVKLSSNGVVEWENADFNGNREDFARHVEQTSDGGYIIVGETKSFGSSDKDVYLIKTDSMGNEEWNKTFGGSEDDSGYCVQEADDGYIITGYTESFGPGNKDLWLIKTNQTGYAPQTGGNAIDYTNNTFNITYGGASDDEGKFVQIIDDGYIITGYTKSFGPGNKDLWLIKTNQTGYAPQTGGNAIDYTNNTFNITYGGKSDDEGICVKKTSDQGYIITGYTNSFPTHNKQLWVIKTNSTGSNQSNDPNDITGTWIFGGENREGGKSICEITGGGYIIIGYRGPGNPETDYIWLLKIDESGNEIKNASFGGNGSVGYSIIESSGGGFIAVGNCTFSNNKDVYVIKTDINLNITEGNNNQSLNKTLIGKGRNSYQLELNNATFYCYLNSTPAISAGFDLYNTTQNWNHLVLTYDKNATERKTKLYLNKELIGSNNSLSGGINTNSGNLTVGKNFSGFIDEVRIWNRVLTYKEIAASYDANITGSYYLNITDSTYQNYSYYSYTISQLGNENSTTEKNITINKYVPNEPGNFLATADSTTQISLEWEKGSRADNTSIRYKEGETAPSNITDGVEIYNDTGNSCVKSSLDEGTYYSFTAWSWNNTGSCWSAENVTVTKKTESSSTSSSTPSSNINTEETQEENETSSETINDTISPSITIIKPKNNDLIYDKTPTIKASFSDDNSIDTSSIVFKLDDILKTASIGSNSIVYTPSSDLPTGSHNVYLKVSDTSGNTKSKTWSFEIIDSDYFESQNITNSTKGNTSIINPLNKTKTIIQKIEFKPNKNYDNLKIEITEIGKNKTIYIEEPSNITIDKTSTNKTYIVYSYLNFSLKSNDTYVKEDIGEIKINFSVDISWLEDNEINISNITMIRYYNNSWTKLITNYTGKTQDKYSFECTTPGFSTFAVVGSKVVEKKEPFNKEKDIVPWIVIIGFILSAIVILIIVLFKAGYIYIEQKE